MKRRFSIFMIVMLMCSILFSTFAFADTSIKGCDVSDEVCKALQEKYGADSEVVYSMVETTTCAYELSITDSNGNKRSVYVSALPKSTEVAPPVIDQDSGSINDSGIVTKPGELGIDEIQLPETSMDEILNWATTKGNEVIYLLQIFCQPFAIIIFIIAAFMTLIGCIGKSDMVGKGVWGMVLSVVVYAAVLYAPVILQSFVGWVAS